MSQDTRELWAKRVERWRESGLTGAEYAAEIGVNEETLRHWKWELGRDLREPGWRSKSARRRRERTRAAFVELVTPPAIAGPAARRADELEPFELVIGKEVRIRVPVRFDGPSLKRLVEALRAH